MNNPDDLTKALAQNGAYDSEKAEELRTKMVGAFEAKMRKVKRYLWAYMCLCCWLVVFTLFHFMQSSSTKALLFYGILMLVFFETTILMKLWYWIMNNKISDAIDPWGLNTGGTLTSKGCITLAPDGSSSAVTEMSFVFEGAFARRGFNFHAPKSAKIRFTNGRAREMPFTTSQHNGHVRYDVRLPGPVMPGRRFSYTRLGEYPNSATKEGRIWTYSSDIGYGYDTNEISQAVVLPEGAEIVSVNPWPASTFTLQGRPTVRFEGTRARNKTLTYTIRYRLAEETSD